MTFHFRVNVEDGLLLPLTWQNEGWMDRCVVGVEGKLPFTYFAYPSLNNIAN